MVSKDNRICGWLGFSMGALSLACSWMTLFLIYKMKQWNGYMLLVTSLVACQMLYDLGHVLEIDYTFSSCMAKKFLNYLGGLSVCFWSAIISYIVLYVTIRSKSLNIYENYKYFFAIAVLPPLAISIVIVSLPHIVETTDSGSCYFQHSSTAQGIYDLYYWSRLFMIIFNFTVVSFITLWLYRKTPAEKLQKKTMAVYTLVNRMKYYPLVQAICRSGAAWNEWNNGREQNFESYVLASIASPLTGTAYFVVFLIMQPHALATLKSFFPCIFKSAVQTVRDSTVRDSERSQSSVGARPSDWQAGDATAITEKTDRSNHTTLTRMMTMTQLENIINDEEDEEEGEDSESAGASEVKQRNSNFMLSIFSKSTVNSSITASSGGSGVRSTINPIQRQSQSQSQPQHTTNSVELSPSVVRGSEVVDSHTQV